MAVRAEQVHDRPRLGGRTGAATAEWGFPVISTRRRAARKRLAVGLASAPPAGVCNPPHTSLPPVGKGFSMGPTFSMLPLLVFVAELCVVTISTVRIIFLSRGMKTFAAVLGFFEVTIWLFAIGQIMM